MYNETIVFPIVSLERSSGSNGGFLTGWWRASFAVAIVDALFRHIVILKVGQIVADARQQVGRRGGDSRRRQMSQMDAVRGRRAGRMGATTATRR